MADVPISSAPPARDNPGEKLSLSTKLAFGAGDLSPAITAILLSFFQLFFLTTVAGLNASVAGTILLVAKVWDAISDPIMGWISDNTRSKHGRRRPWLLWGAVPFSIVFVLQWIVPPLGEAGLIMYYLAMVVLMSTAFTMVSVPYTALTPELSQDYDERTSLNSYRFSFSIGGSLLGLLLHQQIVESFPNEQTGYLVAGIVVGLLMTLPFLWCFAVIRERPRLARDVSSLSIGEQVRFVFGNIPYLFVIGIYLCSWLAIQVTAAVLPFYITYWIQAPDLRLGMIATVQGSALIFLFFWCWVSGKIGKKAVYLIGMVFWIGVQSALFFVQPAQAMIGFLLAALAGVGVATGYLVPWSMMPDVMEFDELRTGQRREGIFYGFMVLAQKFGIGLGLFLVGQALGWQGFDESIPIGQQPESALLAIRIMIGPVPTVFLLLGMVLTWFYPITRQKHEAVRAELAARKETDTTDE